jgi:hypothetical protein
VRGAKHQLTPSLLQLLSPPTPVVDVQRQIIFQNNKQLAGSRGVVPVAFQSSYDLALILEVASAPLN